MPESIPEAVRGFLQEMIDSVAELESLLLARREPNVAWTPSRLAPRVYLNEREAARVLNSLRERQLLGEDYRYAPRAEIDAVAEAWRTALVPITRLIHTKRRTS